MPSTGVSVELVGGPLDGRTMWLENWTHDQPPRTLTLTEGVWALRGTSEETEPLRYDFRVGQPESEL